MRLFSALLTVILISCTTLSNSGATNTTTTNPGVSVDASYTSSLKVPRAKLKDFVNRWARGFESFLTSEYGKVATINIMEYAFLNNSRQAVVRLSISALDEEGDSIALLVISKDFHGDWAIMTIVPISTEEKPGGSDEEL